MPAALRVCADPNNLPFSNERGEGFENQIAELVARDLGTRVSLYVVGAAPRIFRNTLNAGACDLVIGVPSHFDRARHDPTVLPVHLCVRLAAPTGTSPSRRSTIPRCAGCVSAFR